MPRVLWRGIGPAAAVWLCILVGAPTVRSEVLAMDTGRLLELLRTERRQVLLLDVRTPREYSGGRIPGSVLIPMSQVPGRLAEIPKGRKVVVICASGARSAAVARFLDQKGYPWVANYHPGVFGFTTEGFALER